MRSICGTADREAAATIKDMDLIDDLDETLVVDINKKVRGARKKQRKEELVIKIENVVGPVFDGRKDQTLVRVESNGHSKTVRTVEEHITLRLLSREIDLFTYQRKFSHNYKRDHEYL